MSEQTNAESSDVSRSDLAAWRELTGFRRDLLEAVALNERGSGQDVREHVEDEYETQINHGRLYPNLDVLCNKGLIEKGEIDRRTNSYETTPRGKRVLSAGIDRMEEVRDRVSPTPQSDRDENEGGT